MHKHDLLMHKRWFRAVSYSFLTVFLTVSVALVGENASFKASILPTVTHEPFDGTVYPVQQVPKWSSLTTEEYKYAYSAIPSDKFISTPAYDPSDFTVSFSTLKWGDKSTEKLRNAKITYSVPYMGDYSLDSVENSGSHLAVDIKVPMDTPIFAIANGKIIKVSNQSDGFGHHVVLEHDNFPSFDNENTLVTYYSSYSHLDTILVSEGDTVKKGQQIALSGKSGTATTPHLHFQIDNDNAGWHPFWPFTWQEQRDAGLDFFSAINSGLGADKARQTTINPLMYVQKYMDFSGSIDVPDSQTDPQIEVPDEPDVTNDVSSDTDSSLIADNSYTPEVVATPLENKLSFDVKLNNTYDVGDIVHFTVSVKNDSGNLYTDGFDGIALVDLSDSGVGDLDEKMLTSSSFENGVANLRIKNLKSGRAKVKVAFGEDVFYSDFFDVNEPVVTEDTNESTASSFNDVSESHTNYKAITYLAKKGVINGYEDGSFKPDATVTRAEALKFIIEGIEAPVEVAYIPFKDISDKDWSYKYVSTGYLRTIVSGYKDGKFKANNIVTKAEFLKMLFAAMDVTVSDSVKEDPFVDVQKNSWYAKYFKYAKKENIIDSERRAWPDVGMKRSDVAEAMYRVMAMDN